MPQSEPRKEQLADSVTLWLGDCRDVLPLLGRVDAVITDPPYGVNLGKCGDPRGGAHGRNFRGYDGISSDDSYLAFVDEIVPRINSSIDISTRGLIWTGPHIHEQRKPDAIGGVYCPAGAGRHCWGFKQFLPVLLYGNAPALHLGAKCPTSIESSEHPSEDSKSHPVPKPVGWMMWAVNLASLPGETILDSFMGSGTTGVACVDLGRKFIGIEREPKYFDIACRRISEALKRPRLPFEEPRKAVQAEMTL